VSAGEEELVERTAVVGESMRFGPLVIEYDERVLTPRPWTAEQGQWAAELLTELPDGPVLELCCGAGQIGLRAVADSDRRLVCVDASPAAVELARRNAEHAGLQHRVEVREARIAEDLWLDERFVLVIADPPWVPTAEVQRYPEDPVSAIDGGTDGLDVARLCLEVARRHVRPGGIVILQLGTVEQAALLGAEAEALGLEIEETLIIEGSGVLLRLDASDRLDAAVVGT
jgi:release factor glutamine methyltransferase